jgi:hypothetical protein
MGIAMSPSQKMMMERTIAKIGRSIKNFDLYLLATFLRTTLLGMSLQARAGPSRETLMKIGKPALQTWPSPPPVKA